MANEQDKNPTTGTEADISKAQSQQQPPQQASQEQPERAERTGDEAATGQARPGAGPDEASQGDTLTQQRTDVEGASLGTRETSEAEGGFVGSQAGGDTSEQLVEEEQNFGKGGQGAPEGK